MGITFSKPSGGSVDGTAINPSSIGATTQTTSIRVETIDAPSSGVIRVFYGNGSSSALSARGVEIGVNGPVFWTLGSAGAGNPRSLALWMDDSNILAQRNDTNAQESRLYATYTSSTVYERLSSKYDSGTGAFVIGTEKGASGGSARPLWVRIDGTDRLKFNTDGSASYTGSFSATSTISATVISAGYYLKSSAYPLASLDTAAVAGVGSRAFIDDSNVAASGNFGAVAAGGGSNKVPVYSDGTDWRIG